jgi:hypothetical protein
MKAFLLVLLCIPIIGLGQSQGSILSLTFSPANPTNTDTISVYAELAFTSSSCPLDMKGFSVSGNSIVASTHHCVGMLAAICNTVDTFKLAPLATGVYFFHLSLSSGVGGPPCSPGIVPDDGDTITFNVVDSSAGIEDQVITTKKLVHVVDLFGRDANENPFTPLFYIYDDGTVEKKMIVE